MASIKYERNWEDICSETDYAVAKALLETYNENNLTELKKGLEENLKSCISVTEVEYEMKLYKLMSEVIIVKLEKTERTQQRWETICNLRNEIHDIFNDYDFITKKYEKSIWEQTLHLSKKLSKSHSKNTGSIQSLTTEEVYKTNYHPEYYGK